MKLLIVAILIFASTARAQNGQTKIDWPRYQDTAVDLMQKYLRINTSNPPGNEIEAAKWFKTIFDENGIQNEIFEYKPGRANIIARIKGDGSKKPIILLSHTDVVTADASSWSVDPFSGEIRQGSIYGRGAIDMKSVGLVQLMTMLIAKQQNIPLSRDL